MAKIIGILVFALILATPYLAEAECAWVLWEEASLYRSVGGASNWLLHVAHESRADCEKKQSAEIAYRLSAQGGAYGQRSLLGSTVVVTWPDGNTSNWKFICLPDTVDPRGPKGGTTTR